MEARLRVTLFWYKPSLLCYGNSSWKILVSIKNNFIYIIKQKGLYQNKVTLSLASIHSCKMDYCVRANATEDSTGFHIKKERDHSLTPLGDSSNWSLIYQMCLSYSWRWNNDVKINYSMITYSKTPLTCCFLYFRCAAVPVTDWYLYIVMHAQWSALRHNMQMEVVKWLSSLSLVRLILLAFKSIFRTTLSELWRSYH